MTSPVQLFLGLLLSGIFLVGVEIFLPGGILGVIGGLALLAAVITAFVLFGPQLGVFAAIGIVILLGVFIFIWLKYFPNTPIGRALTLSKDMTSQKEEVNSNPDLLNKEGISQTQLRPAGIARIGNQRIDVMAESGWIEKDRKIRVIEIEGNRIVVRELTEQAPQTEAGDNS